MQMRTQCFYAAVMANSKMDYSVSDQEILNLLMS